MRVGEAALGLLLLSGCASSSLRSGVPVEELRRDVAGLRWEEAPGRPAANTHRVARGETLWSIARRWGVTVADLKRANGLTGDTIFVGQELIIPAGTAAAGASAPRTAPGSGEPGFVWPVPGLRQARSDGEALLIYAPQGTSVVAAATGRISYVSPHVRGLGAVVMVEHGGGLVSLYGRLEQVAVSVGDWVSRGEPIGRVGPGDEDGPRLRFMVFKEGKAVPARDYVAP